MALIFFCFFFFRASELVRSGRAPGSGGDLDTAGAAHPALRLRVWSRVRSRPRVRPRLGRRSHLVRLPLLLQRRWRSHPTSAPPTPPPRTVGIVGVLRGPQLLRKGSIHLQDHGQDQRAAAAQRLRAGRGLCPTTNPSRSVATSTCAPFRQFHRLRLRRSSPCPPRRSWSLSVQRFSCLGKACALSLITRERETGGLARPFLCVLCNFGH